MRTKILGYLFNLFFPRTCCCCDAMLVQSENQICTHCFFKLPLTNFINLNSNNVEKLFWGKAQIEAATALLYFVKKENVQKILHQIKYKNNIKLAHLMGNQMGIELKNSDRFQDIDVIIPVPLHWKKKRKRGYNQSEEIAKGIALHFDKPINTTCLVRKKHTNTQTKKDRIERWENVADKFTVLNRHELEGKHILLVDDVVTTGATLEACALEILNIPNTKISVATLAYAGK